MNTNDEDFKKTCEILRENIVKYMDKIGEMDYHYIMDDIEYIEKSYEIAIKNGGMHK